MGKAIKTFIILNLLLSIGVAIYGFLLFQDRQVVKARTLLLQDNAERVATNLNWGQEVDWESPEDRRPGRFVVPQPALPEELPSMENTLGELSRFATQRLAQLNQRYAELVETQRELAETLATLAIREQELADTREQLASARAHIAVLEEDLRQSRLEINTLRVERDGLERQVESLNVQLADRDDQIASLEVDIVRLQQDLERATQRELARTQGVQGSEEWKGRTASILAVNERFQFIILDKGAVDVLPYGLEAIVHRGDEFIGTVIIREVEELVAIAEINHATLTPGKTIRTTDTLFF